MAKKTNTKIIAPLFLLVATLIVGFIYQFNRNEMQDIRSRAEEDNAKFCEDQCTGRNRCDFNDTTRTDDPNLNDPCCEELKKTGDPLACPWPQRGYCTDDQCSAIPEGVSRQRCGGPRHSWCNECVSRNCPGYGNNSPTTPPVIPTSAPQPTRVVVFPTEPIIFPTDVPPTFLPIPTQPERPKPTAVYIPPVLPTSIISIPTIKPTSTPPKFTLPNILPPKEKVDSFFTSVKTNLLDFFSKILP